MGFRQTFTASWPGKKGGFHRNFNMQRQIRDTTGLSICTDLGKNDILRHPSFLLYTWQKSGSGILLLI